MNPYRWGPLFGAVLSALTLAACDSGNPVAPGDPRTETPSSTFSITLGADPPRLTAGASTGSAISVSVVRNDTGQPPANGTELALNTSLGNFGVTAQGDPVQLVMLTLSGGAARTTLLADAEDVGTAALLAQLSDSSAQLNVPISEPGEAPVADFVFEVDGLTAIFADASTGDPTSWAWSFGDGDSSSDQNPTHTYDAAGTYAVKLTARNDGGSNSKNQLVTVPSGDPPAVDFTFEVDGFTVHFLDASTGNPTSWSWLFGDDDTSNEQNPSHTYTSAGTFTVTLTATNDAGSAAGSQLVTVPSGDPPAADFTFQADDLTVTFADASTGNPTSWAWDFGDGDTSSDQNPTHDYDAGGTYTVSLTATNDAGSDTKNQLVTVMEPPPPDPPTADFTFVVNGFDVNFLDASTGEPTSWAWEFGDGDTSGDQNPAHTYDAAGIFTVTLTATNDAGSDSASELVTIAPGDPPMAEFSFEINDRTVIFTDLSTGDVDEWSWTFGDGSAMSSQQNPVHCYDADGTYPVSLTVTNDAGSDSTSKFITVNDPDDNPCP